MFHRTIYLKYKEGVAQADATEMLRAFQNLPRQVEGLVNVSVDLTQMVYDARIDLCFATEQARRVCDFSDAWRNAWTRAQALAEQLESNDSIDEQGVAYDANGAPLPMKWHKFLIYFALWAGAILNGISGIQTLSNALNPNSLMWGLYGLSTGLRAFYIVSGVFSFGLGVFQICTRMSLARLSRRGPRMAVWNYALSFILNALTILLASVLFGMPINALMDWSMWLILIEGALMTWANQVYYRKRAAMFVH